MELNPLTQIEHIYIHRDSLESEVAHRVQQLFSREIIEVVDNKPLTDIKGTLSPEDYDRSKKTLYLTKFKGEFFKRCPGAKPGLTCCNYFVLNLGQQCNMNCSYCYLQSYLNSPLLTVFTNIDVALENLKHIAKEYPNRSYRVGTGEVIDSLSLDEITLFSQKLISFFKDLPNWLLELKTKSSKVDQFLETPHANNVICSWSINPEYIIDKEEHGTASLENRLKAAEKCLQKNFLLSFHIDPMIWHPEWKYNYQDLVQQITSRFKPHQIKYITVGSLRFQPEQRHMMRTRFGLNSHVTQAEVFQSKDGKMRYDSSLRTDMFQTLVKLFKDHDPKWRVSLCMEVPETWSTTMSSTPLKVPELKSFFKPV